MKILKNSLQLKKYLQDIKNKSSIGFTPTMGALHKGHLSLFKKSSEENTISIASIFVNPTQFNNEKDLEKYPRTITEDIALLKESSWIDAVYIPQINDLYPFGLYKKNYNFGGLENEMEGKFRPGHFDGVGTVVEILLRQIQPDRTYFGEKDFQQLSIIKKMIKNLCLNTEIVPIPIVREENGLAMSSRNKRLSPEQKENAKIIYETLLKVNDWFQVISIREITKKVYDIFNKSNFTLEYFIIADEETLKEVQIFHSEKKYRAFIAAYIENIRLIDNLHLISKNDAHLPRVK